MKGTLALLLLCSIAHAEAAPPTPPASSLAPEVRIQRRFVEKKGRLCTYAGVAYNARGDFYRSPGVELAVSYYLRESLAVDLRGAWFFTYASDELRNVVDRTGFVPDSRPSRALVLAGGRLTVGYAKIRVSASLVLHFEPQVFLYGGVHVTSGDFARASAAPVAELGLGFLVYLTPRAQLRLDAGLTVGGESRSSYVAVFGGLPVMSAGVMF